ncbi:hypothetical protein BMW24_022245 [Mycobacterium heckeshornense]|nr:hypothetical protein BMW24_022245 [Mycobacterium heckeshornense]
MYSNQYSACAEVYQPDPPGLIHDDPRLLPPWRGSSLFESSGERCGITFPTAGGELVAELSTDRPLSTKSAVGLVV